MPGELQPWLTYYYLARAHLDHGTVFDLIDRVGGHEGDLDLLLALRGAEAKYRREKAKAERLERARSR